MTGSRGVVEVARLLPRQEWDPERRVTVGRSQAQVLFWHQYGRGRGVAPPPGTSILRTIRSYLTLNPIRDCVFYLENGRSVLCSQVGSGTLHC